MKQGWAFAWRSLLAGELLVQIAGKPSIGSRLEVERTFGDYEGMIAVMIIILVIGIIIDAAGFNTIERVLRRRRGLTELTRSAPGGAEQIRRGAARSAR